jgi:putative redox protein
MAESLVNEGFVVFRFDFYGSGESPGALGDRTWSIAEQNARDAIEYLKSRGAENIGLWGRSIGGTVAVLCSDIPSVQAFVLATTPVLLREVFLERFEKVKKLELELEQKGQRLPGTGHFKGEFEINMKFFEEVPITEERVMRNLVRMRRVFVMGTTPDTKVPLNNPATIINTVKEPKRIWIFEKVDHDYKGVEKEALGMAVSWFKKYVK